MKYYYWYGTIFELNVDELICLGIFSLTEYSKYCMMIIYLILCLLKEVFPRDFIWLANKQSLCFLIRLAIV